MLEVCSILKHTCMSLTSLLLQGEGPVTLPSLWVTSVETGKARQLLGAPEYALNTILDQLRVLQHLGVSLVHITKFILSFGSRARVIEIVEAI